MSDLPHLAMSLNWHPWEKTVFLRAKGHCEYCDRDMMESSDTFFHFRNFDHIRPEEGNGVENMAVACRACSNIKRHTKIEGETRADMIANAKSYIQRIRERNNRRLAADREWFQQQLAAQAQSDSAQ